MYKDISHHINKNRGWAVSLVRQLVRIPTVNPPGENYEALVKALEGHLKKMGLATEKIATPGSVLKKHRIAAGSPRVSLIADWPTGSKKTFHINGHYDVVPASGKWRFPPFKAVMRGDKIYGRGTEDMKGTITAMALAVKTLRELGLRPKVNIQLSFCPDEEIGGRTGFGWLVETGRIKADFGMTEGLGYDCVSCGNKGIFWGRIHSFGKTAHGSLPYKGINSFDGMLALCEELKRLDRKISKRKTRYRMINAKDRHPTLVLGGEVSGGKKGNIVPDQTSFSIDRRLIPEENLALARREIEDAIARVSKRHKDYRYKLEVMAQDSPVFVDPDEKICRAIGDAVYKVLRRKPRICLMPGGTDIRYLIKKGIPSVGYSARGSGRWHSTDEFIRVKSILDAAKVYALTIMNL